MIHNIPNLVVERDFDGYFEGLVREWIDRKTHAQQPFKHDFIHVTAAPFLPDAVTTETITSAATGDKFLYLTFYSALRTGFGLLQESDIVKLIEML